MVWSVANWPSCSLLNWWNCIRMESETTILHSQRLPKGNVFLVLNCCTDKNLCKLLNMHLSVSCPIWSSRCVAQIGFGKIWMKRLRWNVLIALGDRICARTVCFVDIATRTTKLDPRFRICVVYSLRIVSIFGGTSNVNQWLRICDNTNTHNACMCILN